MSEKMRYASTIALIAIAMNLFFLLWTVFAATWDSKPVAERVEAAFASGSLDEQDWLYLDCRRGNNQHNDCLVLHLLLNESGDLISKSLAPVGMTSDRSFSDSCPPLKRLIEGEDTADLIATGYTRYWHGYVTTTSLLLRTTDLQTAREAMKISIYLLLAVLIIVSWSRGGLVAAWGTSFGLFGLLVWGLPYFGQGLSLAPGDLTLVGGLIAAVYLGRRVSDLGFYVLCTVYGSLIAYFEMMTGQIPTASGLLFVLSYLLRDKSGVNAAWLFAGISLASFWVGIGATVAIKQILTLIFISADNVGGFVSNLTHYTGSRSLWSRAVDPIIALSDNRYILTYGRMRWAKYVILLAGFLWTLGFILALKSRSGPRNRYFAHVAGALAVAGWIVLFPTHTQQHSWMVRILIVPISLSLSSVLCFFDGGVVKDAFRRITFSKARSEPVPAARKDRRLARTVYAL
jgi:hypothetical protein